MATSGERIKERRKALGLSADDLAARIGKDRATIFRYEKGEIENMPLVVIYNLAEALHVSPGYLMGWEREATAPSRKFRDSIREEMNNADSADIADAAKSGMDAAFLDSVIKGDGPVTLDDACKAADELGTTVGALLGEESRPTTSDESAAEFARIFSLLAPEKQQVILAAMQSFLTAQESAAGDQEKDE